MSDFDLGPGSALRNLCEEYPGPDVYTEGFRTQWGPIFYRGRLSGEARLLVIGQDPAQHEAVVRRILVGEAGRRVQGFIRKLGFTRSYVMVNTYLYGIYDQRVAFRHADAPGIVAYRHRWFDALFAAGPIDVVVAFGAQAHQAWQRYRDAMPGSAPAPLYEHVMHPTAPGKGHPLITTAKLLENWNHAIQRLHPRIAHPDLAAPLVPYGDDFRVDELPEIPSFDLPAGTPAWMREGVDWARMAEDPGPQRANVTIQVPAL